jgi:hypothetical protein
MAYTANTILIRPGAVESGPEKLLRDLGYENLSKISDCPFGEAIGTAGWNWIGTLGDCVIIEGYVAQDLFVDMPTKFKAALLRRFPDSDIAALTKQSTVGHWGFAVYRKGELIRCQHGVDSIVVREFGAHLPIEESYLAKRRIISKGKITYRNPGDLESEMTEGDFGSDIVWEIFKSFTGLSPNEKNVHHTPGSAFAADDPESTAAYNAIYEEALRPAAPLPPKPIKPPFWQFWRK